MTQGVAQTRPELMRHQQEGVAFLLHRKSGLIAFEQGLGKTLVAISAYAELRRADAVDLLVVLCPNSLKRNWAAEIARFAPHLTVTIVEGAARERRAALGSVATDVVVISYESARNDITGVRALLGRLRAVLTLDESHYAKNRQSLTNIAARHFAPLVEYRWLLSGTPVTNAPSDLYAQISVAEAGSPLGSFNAFMARYGTGSAPTQRLELAERVRPYVLRRTKEDCLDLLSKTFVDIAIELPAWQRQLYEAMRDDVVTEVQGMTPEQFKRFAPTALTRLLRLSQLASNPALVLQGDPRTPGKFLELDRLLDELVADSGRKVIVWSYYVRTIEELGRRYERLRPVTLYGGTEASARQSIAKRFQDDPDTRLLIANPAAAGTGFTLTAATYAIYETLTWRYDLYAQSQDRNHRIGQTQPVTYIRLLAADTIEPSIAAVLERKTQLARSLVGDTDLLPHVEDMTPEQFISLIRTGELPTS